MRMIDLSSSKPNANQTRAGSAALQLATPAKAFLLKEEMPCDSEN